MKSFKIKIDVPQDFKPGQCDDCPFIDYLEDRREMCCDLDPRSRNPNCLLIEIDKNTESR